jgi:predicted MPP superfamily phosphohydrolase
VSVEGDQFRGRVVPTAWSGSRRRLLAGGAALAVGGVFDAIALEPNWLDVTEHDVAVPGLHRVLDGFAIAQVTDAHLDGIGRVEEAIARALNAHDVQLLVLTGDIIDSTERLDTLREFCGSLRRAGMITIATLGNWEHWGKLSAPELHAAYAETSVKLLVNEETTSGAGLAWRPSTVSLIVFVGWARTGEIAEEQRQAGLVERPRR